ncbi:acyl-CoA thioesterase [Halosegnis marinus]|uniref:Acyl-CoA thioesterase n=1 Tax=Halosegnis marinus TaxID=3034023 RepID=A0ABD5ZMB9_9EURY|nr:thioesterase family protein [Halosegnis sp. DT85]
MDDAFRFTEEIPLRLRDLDQMNHVNNAVYATFLEQARSAYFRDVVGRPLNGVGMVIADLELDFERGVTLDAGRVTVGARVTELGRSSIPMAYQVWADGERAATGATTMVHVDREAGGSKPIPDAWRETITEFEGLEP